MFWSISTTGRINGFGEDEEFARNWARTYPDDIAFQADLVPPIEIPLAFTEEQWVEGKYKEGNKSYSEEVRRRFDAANAPHQKEKQS